MTSEVGEYRTLLVEIAGPTRLGDSVKSVLARIARKTGLTDRRVRSIWHGEVKDIRARELTALVRAASDAKALEEAQHERDQLLARLAACEAALGLSPTNGARPLADPSSAEARGSDRSLAEGG